MPGLLKRMKEAFAEQYVGGGTSDKEENGDIFLKAGEVKLPGRYFDILLEMGYVLETGNIPSIVDGKFYDAAQEKIKIVLLVHNHLPPEDCLAEHCVSNITDIIETEDGRYSGPDIFQPPSEWIDVSESAYTTEEIISSLKNIDRFDIKDYGFGFKTDSQCVSRDDVREMICALKESENLGQFMAYTGGTMGIFYHSDGTLEPDSGFMLIEVLRDYFGAEHEKREDLLKKLTILGNADFRMRINNLSHTEDESLVRLMGIISNMPFEEAYSLACNNNKVKALNTGRFGCPNLAFYDSAGFAKDFPEIEFDPMPLKIKVLPEAANDSRFLDSLVIAAGLMKRESPFIDDCSMQTSCFKAEGEGRDYFAKKLNFFKVPYSDFELEMASRLIEKGIDVMKPVGLVELNSVPFVVFEYAKNVVSLNGFDCSYESDKRYVELLHNNEKEIYLSLGVYIREMFDNGIYDKDMAKRNFMAGFDEDGKFKKVFMVDFEKTRIEDNLPIGKREESLKLLVDQFSESESRYFMMGYNSD